MVFSGKRDENMLLLETLICRGNLKKNKPNLNKTEGRQDQHKIQRKSVEKN